MMRKMMLALLAAMTMPVAAQGATISGEYKFAGRFTVADYEGRPSQVEKYGSMAIDYDTVTRAYSLTDFTLKINGTDFDTSNVLVKTLDAGRLLIGGEYLGLASPNGDNDDFLLTLSFDETFELRKVLGFAFSFNGGNGAGINANDSIVFGRLLPAESGEGTPPSGPPSGGPGPGAVPEPSTWALMLAGFGAVGVAMRRARRKLRLRLA